VEFFAAAPVVAAAWMLAGLSGGLAPSLVRSVFGINSFFIGGFVGFVAPAVSTVIDLALTSVPLRRAMTIGIVTSVIGALGIVAGVVAGSLTLLIVGQAIAGIGFGSAFTAALQLLIPLVQPHERGGLIAAVYVVSYAAFGIPVVIEGQLVGPLGDTAAVACYTGLTVLLALVSLIAQARLKRRR
jgi:MFS family permease